MHPAGNCYGFFFLRLIVGPPPDVNWNGPWHEILHEWRIRIEQQLDCNVFKLWSHKYLADYWKFENYVAVLPERRWITRVLAWHPRQERLGRTFTTWDLPLQHFAGGNISGIRYSQLKPPTYGSTTSTISLLSYLNELCNCVGFTPCALNGLSTRMQAQSQSQSGRHLLLRSSRFFLLPAASRCAVPRVGVANSKDGEMETSGHHWSVPVIAAILPCFTYRHPS